MLSGLILIWSIVARLFAVGLFCGIRLLLAMPACPESAARPPQTELQVSRLLAKMMIEEKIGQMRQLFYGDKANQDELIRKGEVGAFLNLTDPVEANRLQHIMPPSARALAKGYVLQGQAHLGSAVQEVS